MKNKGFTMVELLATILILGILMTIAIGAYSRYRERASRDAYKTLSKSAANAAENYFMDNLNNDKTVTVDLQTLVDEEYLESLKDPWDKEKECKGIVVREEESTKQQDSIDSYTYNVTLKCSRGCKCTYPNKDSCQCKTD